jgi:thiol-disulfide isomerase/thioredoxin
MKTLEITSKNKKKVDALLKSKKPTILLFYMNGCSHCTALHPTWKEVATNFEKDKDIDVAEVEFSSMGLLPENIRKSIAGFPTIQILKGGKATAEYMGDRSKESIIEFGNKAKEPSTILSQTVGKKKELKPKPKTKTAK